MLRYAVYYEAVIVVQDWFSTFTAFVHDFSSIFSKN